MTTTACDRARSRGLVSLLALAAIALSFQRPARAEAEPRARIGIAVHPEVGFALPLGGGKSDSSPALAALGAGVGYEIGRHLEIEASIAKLMPGSRAVAASSGNGTDFVHIDPGLMWRGLVRYRRGENGGLVLGAGPGLITSGNFGTVPLLAAEAGYELRAASGFYLLAAAQFIEPLSASATDVDGSRCFTSGCPSKFDPAKPVVGSRVAVGLVF
jgi:hypothetical protein